MIKIDRGSETETTKNRQIHKTAHRHPPLVMTKHLLHKDTCTIHCILPNVAVRWRYVRYVVFVWPTLWASDSPSFGCEMFQLSWLFSHNRYEGQIKPHHWVMLHRFFAPHHPRSLQGHRHQCYASSGRLFHKNEKTWPNPLHTYSWINYISLWYMFINCAHVQWWNQNSTEMQSSSNLMNMHIISVFHRRR